MQAAELATNQVDKSQRWDSKIRAIVENRVGKAVHQIDVEMQTNTKVAIPHSVKNLVGKLVQGMKEIKVGGLEMRN